VPSSHAKAANATLSGHKQRGYGKKSTGGVCKEKIWRNPMKKEEHEK